MKALVVVNLFKYLYNNIWEPREADLDSYNDDPVETFFLAMSVLIYDQNRQKKRLRDNGRCFILSEYQDNEIYKYVSLSNAGITYCSTILDRQFKQNKSVIILKYTLFG